MHIHIEFDDWFANWRTTIFSMKTLRKYPRELAKLIRTIRRISLRNALNPYLFMLVFEVYWSIYFGPIMPWKATSEHCLMYQKGLCSSCVGPAKCLILKALEEVKRVTETCSDVIYVKVEPRKAIVEVIDI